MRNRSTVELSAAAKKAIENDPLGLLKDSDSCSQHRTSSSVLVRHFEAITSFLKINKREPSITSCDMSELQLASILEGIRSDPQKYEELKHLDVDGVLLSKGAKGTSIEDNPLNFDPLGLLKDSSETSIFKLRNVRKSPRINPDAIQRRKRCVNFDDYRSGFEKIKEELRSGLRMRMVFQEQDLIPGRYYCLNGIILYFESMDAEDKNFSFDSGSRTRLDGPVHIVFDNQTESNMLYRSLVKALSIPGEGFSISAPLSLKSMQDIGKGDKLHGHLYVLKSMSQDPKIKAIENLFKIGYSENSVEDRVKDAHRESTYLRAPVKILRDIEVYNVDAHVFESKVHAFFRMSNPSFTVLGEDGKQHYPKEWFIAPLSIIDRAIELIASGNGDDFYYDPRIKDIIKI